MLWSHKRERKLPLNSIKLIFIVAVTLVIAMLPTEAFGIDGLTAVHQRIIALFVFAALMWLTETMPSWVTSMIVVSVMLLTVSTSAFKPLRTESTTKTEAMQIACDRALAAEIKAKHVVDSLVQIPVGKRDAAVFNSAVQEYNNAHMKAENMNRLREYSDITIAEAKKKDAEYKEKKFTPYVPFKDIMGCFANPTIMLFIGGFVLAIGLTKVKLDVALARVLLKPFGTRSEIVLLGFILVTAIFSAFVSNTATAAMMLAFLTPVLRSLPADGKGRIALALAIPVGANLGGMMTPIGTPPNMIALDYLASIGQGISFVDWTIKMAPFVIVLLVLAWLLLRVLFPFKQKNIKIEIEGEIKWDYKTWSVVAAFVITIFMWMFGTDLWNIDTNVVAMIPIAIFCATGILTRRDLEEINWSVLWMVAGGFALGVALNYKVNDFRRIYS